MGSMAVLRSAARQDRAPSIDLALQGGGSHGAFTWGVLDTLLDSGAVHLDGISGTSAGALNAAILAVGWARGGSAGAREALRAFWMDVASTGACFGGGAGSAADVSAFKLPIPPLPWSSPVGTDWQRFNLPANPWTWWGQWWLKQFAPAQFNPLGLDPLRGLLERHVDVPLLRKSPLKLFVTATDVQTGQPEVFEGERLGIDALLASACLPQLFRPVVIEGRSFWDGGYTGNPALWPLIYNTESSDVLLVKINPLRRANVPDTADEIAERVNEITFNASLVSEMRAIHFVQKLLAQQRLDAHHYKHLRLHMIADEQALSQLRPSSKLNTEREFLLALHALGQSAAQQWLKTQLSAVGQRSSVDIEKVFLAPRQGRGAD